jgi:hypothetical protein
VLSLAAAIVIVAIVLAVAAVIVSIPSIVVPIVAALVPVRVVAAVVRSSLPAAAAEAVVPVRIVAAMMTAPGAVRAVPPVDPEARPDVDAGEQTVAAVDVGPVVDFRTHPDGVSVDDVLMAVRSVVGAAAEEDLEMTAVVIVDPLGDRHEMPERVVHVLADLAMHLPRRRDVGPGRRHCASQSDSGKRDGEERPAVATASSSVGT